MNKYIYSRYIDTYTLAFRKLGILYHSNAPVKRMLSLLTLVVNLIPKKACVTNFLY